MKKIVTVTMIAGLFLVSFNSMAQERKLPDGTIVYGDGTRKLPNGTIIYKGGTTVDNRGTNVSLPDGSVIYPDGTRSYPDNRKYNGQRNGKRLPPGQAKKIYGGSARDYAPGQQNKGKGKHEWKDDDDDRKEKKHGKGHRD